MKLNDDTNENLTLEPLDEGDSLGLATRFRDRKAGVAAELALRLDDHAQELLLREWMAIRLKQQGHGALARALRRSPADLGLMEKVLAFVAVEVSR